MIILCADDTVLMTETRDFYIFISVEWFLKNAIKNGYQIQKQTNLTKIINFGKGNQSEIVSFCTTEIKMSKNSNIKES